MAVLHSVVCLLLLCCADAGFAVGTSAVVQACSGGFAELDQLHAAPSAAVAQILHHHEVLALHYATQHSLLAIVHTFRLAVVTALPWQ
jgi:hypothetical protein